MSGNNSTPDCIINPKISMFDYGQIKDGKTFILFQIVMGYNNSTKEFWTYSVSLILRLENSLKSATGGKNYNYDTKSNGDLISQLTGFEKIK